MDKFFGNIRAAFQSEQETGDNAGFIDEMLFIVGIALAAVAVSNWIGAAGMNKGADIASCIEGTNIAASSNDDTYCNGGQSHSRDNSFTNDNGYKKRFP